MIEIITAHEAEQRAEVRKPMARPTHPTCNGNCMQGRACDCTASVADDWEASMSEEWQATTLKDDAWFWGGLAAALLVLVAGAAVMAGWRP